MDSIDQSDIETDAEAVNSSFRTISTKSSFSDLSGHGVFRQSSPVVHGRTRTISSESYKTRQNDANEQFAEVDLNVATGLRRSRRFGSSKNRLKDVKKWVIEKTKKKSGIVDDQLQHERAIIKELQEEITRLKSVVTLYQEKLESFEEGRVNIYTKNYQCGDNNSIYDVSNECETVLFGYFENLKTKMEHLDELQSTMNEMTEELKSLKKEMQSESAHVKLNYTISLTDERVMLRCIEEIRMMEEIPASHDAFRSLPKNAHFKRSNWSKYTFNSDVAWN
ncbi:uncharacterized protein LOC128215965 [Mya arenaria]|uniref:uncharacterized protein LOC128215965 n=1 Tax=Mya arenaria TaxID=6604 RepID=UPI0022E92715|nr:uncharacterized protein LOC128215965 [Mya arenaria]